MTAQRGEPEPYSVEAADELVEDLAHDLGVQLWWHAYGQVRADLGGCWHLVVYGGCTAAPKLAADPNMLAALGHGAYLGSWDHPPTEAEKDEVTPDEYRSGAAS